MSPIRANGIKKDIFAGFIIFFAVIGILFGILINNVYLKSFEDLEKMNVEKNIQIVKNEINSSSDELVSYCYDWGCWDDTYLFAQGLDENYIETNSVDVNFDMYSVDFILFTDDSGKVLYGKQKNFETQEIEKIDNSVLEIIFNSNIFENKNPGEYFNDMVVINGVPVLIAAQPILKSDDTGPAEGNLLFGRIMDNEMMNEISEKLGLKVSFELISRVDFDKQKEKDSEIKPISDDYILGSYYMSELFEKYYTKISIEMPRDVFKIGYDSMKIIRFIVPSIFTLILLLLWFFLNKLVIARIIKLNQQVSEIKKENSASARINLNDKKTDEISELSQSINNMLDGLEDLQKEIYEANNFLEKKVLERTDELQFTNHRLENEIIERKKIQDEVTFLAYHDALTGLPNRLLLTDRLKQGILRANRQETLISIMFIDLDGFKIINDTLGHDQGDQLLKQFAERLSDIVRKNDTVCRIGGDEFILYINGYNAEDDLDIIASKIMDNFKKPFSLKGQEYFITGSMGISQYPIDGDDVDTLIKNADMAMYKAKGLGKNQYQKCSHDLKYSALETMSFTNSLYRAIERNEMMLYYQPQVNGLTGEIIGVEALLRWNHPEHGFVPPSKFIPLAEKTRLILPIGYWVLETACAQCKAWQEKGFKTIRMAVNFSVYQLDNPDIVQQIKDALKHASLPAQYLEIEITESTIMDHNGRIKQTLENIKNIGVSLSIDDFGKEYSSLNRLKELPIDRVKIDMSFVQGIGMSDKDETITKAIILLASNLGLQTIAEGVETKNQMEFLNQRMCNELQGYYLHKPMPASEMEKLLALNSSIV